MTSGPPRGPLGAARRSARWLAYGEPATSTAGFALCAFLVFSVPIFTWASAQNAFVPPKEALVASVTAFLWAFLLAGSFLRSPARVPLQPVNALLAAWTLWRFVAVAWAQSPGLAWDDARRTLLYTGLAFGIQAVAGSRRRVAFLAGTFAASSVVLALWVLKTDFASAFGWGSAPAVRAVLGDWRDLVGAAGLGNSGHVADWIAVGFLVALGGLVATRRRHVAWTLLAVLWVQAAALVVCWSVHTNLSLVVGSLLLAWLLRHWLREPGVKRRLRRRLAAAAVGWALVVAFFVVDHPANPHGSAVWGGGSGSGGIFHQAFSSDRWKAGGSTRIAIWLTTLEVIRGHTVLGAGTGSFTYEYPAAASELLAADPDLAGYRGSWTNAAHNVALQEWAETGIVGLALLVAVIGAAFYLYARRIRDSGFGNSVLLASGMAVLAAWCIQGMMTFPLQMPAGTLVFVLAISLPAALEQRGDGVMPLRMPVSRGWGPLEAVVTLENLHRPTDLGFQVRVPRAVGVAALGVFLALACWAGWHATRFVRADVAYNAVYRGTRGPWSALSGTEAPRLLDLADRCLAIDPRHVDCRAERVKLLMRLGRWEEALTENQAVRERLNATEVYIREAQALQALGRETEADRAWAEVFRRNPLHGFAHPDAFERWSRERQAHGDGSPSPLP